MPSQIIHVLAGETAFRRSGMTPPLSGTGDAFSPAFLLGCQGPDIFSHNRRTKPLALAYSRLLHRRGYGTFCRNFASALVRSPSALAAAWFYGFVTHQAVDRAFHPYIVNRSYVAGVSGIPGVSPFHLHAFLERILDVCLLAGLEGRRVSEFDTGTPFALDPRDAACLSDWISKAIRETYPDETADDMCIGTRVGNAFRDTIYFYELTNPVETSMRDQSGTEAIRVFEGFGIAGAALLYPEYPDPAVDWLNENRRVWAHPVTGTASTLSVPDMFERAVSAAAAAIELSSRVLSGTASPAELETLIGNGSLSAADGDGSPGPIRYAEPFDLASALLAESRRRHSWLDTGFS